MRKKATEIQKPESIFTDWAYNIKPCHWIVFGLLRVERIDKSRTKTLRERLMLSGNKDKTSAAKHKIMKFVWINHIDPDYSFQTGDVFHAKNGNDIIQVIALTPSYIEAHYHHQGSHAYRVTKH